MLGWYSGSTRVVPEQHYLTSRMATQIPPAGTGTGPRVQVTDAGLHAPKHEPMTALQVRRSPFPQQRSWPLQHESAHDSPVIGLLLFASPKAERGCLSVIPP